MKPFREWLREAEIKEKGIYVAVKYNQSTGDDLLEFIKKYILNKIIARKNIKVKKLLNDNFKAIQISLITYLRI